MKAVLHRAHAGQFLFDALINGVDVVAAARRNLFSDYCYAVQKG